MHTRTLLFLSALALTGCPGETAVVNDDTGTTGDDTGGDDTGPVDEPGGDFDSAEALTLADGLVQFDDAVGEAGDRDFYEVELEAGQYYTIMSNRINNQPPDQGSPDTVLRIYDAEENLIAENDDMPRRQFDTDSAIIVRPTTTSTYFVEVLEWSDWDASSAAEGGDDWTYVLTIVAWADRELNEDDAALGTDNDTVADALAASLDEEPDWWADSFANIVTGQSAFLYQYGAIDSDGDVDLFGLTWEDTAEDPFEPSVCQWSSYPGIPTDLDPRMRLVAEDGTQLATTDDPAIYPEYTFLWDGGITFPVANPGSYFIEMSSDTAGAGGASHWYAFENVCYPAVFDDGVNPPVVQFGFDEEDSGSVFDATPNTIPMRESTATAGIWFGSFVGWLDDGGADVDYWRLDTGVASGQKITVSVEDIRGGSTLGDSRVILMDAAGAELGTEDGPNATFDLTLAVGAPLYVSVESISGANGADVYYLGDILLE